MIIEPKELCFSIPMTPVPWARPAGKTQRYDSQINAKAAFAILAIAEIRASGITTTPGKPFFPKGTPIKANLAFGYNNDGIRTKNSITPLLKHDVDNLCKFTLDACQSQALEKVIWEDDSQVIQLFAEKIFTCGRPFICCSFQQVTVNLIGDIPNVK